LELHPEKTRLVEFGRWAARDRQRRGKGKPETSTSWVYTQLHEDRKGRFAVLRQTMRKRMQATLHEVKAELLAAHATTVPEQGAYLRAVF